MSIVNISDNLFCALSHESEKPFRAVIWEYGGAINGCHQPWTVLEIYEGAEIDVRGFVERKYPGIQYRQKPVIKDGALFDGPERFSRDVTLCQMLGRCDKPQALVSLRIDLGLD